MIFTNWHTRLIKRFLFLLIPYSLLRIGFYFYHFDVYRHFELSEIFTSFLIGIRFDIAAICLINIPIILLSLVPSNKTNFFKFERLLFTFINTCGFIVSIDDYELFLFMGKRLSYDFFAITDDILEQLPQVFLYYWYLPIIGLVMSAGVYYFDKKFFKIQDSNSKTLNVWLGGILLLGLSFVGIRGGLQHKSINVQSAFIQGKMNSPSCFKYSLSLFENSKE